MYFPKEITFVIFIWDLMEIALFSDASLYLSTTTPVAVGDVVTLTCTMSNPNYSKTLVWRRNNIILVSMFFNKTGCYHIITNPDSHYEYICGESPVKLFNLTIPSRNMTEQQHNSNWTCEIILGSRSNTLYLNVSVPVEKVTLHSSTEDIGIQVIKDGEAVQFKCITTPSRPAVRSNDIYWFRNTQMIINDSNTTTIQQKGDKYITTMEIVIPGKAEDEESDILCKVKNANTKSFISSNSIRLVVLWKPSINATITGYTTGSGVRENSTVTLICRVQGGKPLSLLSWSGMCSGSAATNQSLPNMSVSEIMISVNRSYNGKNCTCTATHRVKSYGSSQSVTFTITYPPTLQVKLQNSTEKASNVTIRCIGDGEPNNMTIISWSQKIAGTIVRTTTNFKHVSEDKAVITLSNVNFKDTGQYTCKATNGIPDRNNIQEQSGSSYLDVNVSAKYYPNLLQHKFYGITGNMLSVKVPFYSNPPADHAIWFNKTSNASLIMSSQDNITFSFKDGVIIKKRIFGKLLSLLGQAAEMNISTFSKYHQGNYSLTIENSKHLVSSTNVVLIPSGPPDIPKSLKVLSVTGYTIVLHWKRGFNGGHKQTFAINFIEAESMKNVIDSKETEEIDSESNYYMTVRSLKPDTKYNISLNAYNQVGSSLFRSILVSTKKEAVSTVVIIGAVASISLTLIIIGAFSLKKRLTKNTGNHSDVIKVRYSISHDNDPDDGMKPNIIYESAGSYFADNNDFDHVVDVSAPDKERNVIYAVVNKPKKSTINSGASSCAELDQSYENWKGGVNSIRGKSDAGIMQSKPSRKKNKEGLDYVEVFLKDTSSDQNVRVIHGIENRNDYADIDFSRHADALPSDDEEDAMPCVNPRDDTTSL